MPLATVCVSSCGASSSISLSATASEQLNTQGQVVRKWIKLRRLNCALSCPQNSTQLIIRSSALWRVEVDFLDITFEKIFKQSGLEVCSQWLHWNSVCLCETKLHSSTNNHAEHSAFSSKSQVKGVPLSWRHLLAHYVRWHGPFKQNCNTFKHLLVVEEKKKGGGGGGGGGKKIRRWCFVIM